VLGHEPNLSGWEQGNAAASIQHDIETVGTIKREEFSD
jgi:hypothetical protein